MRLLRVPFIAWAWLIPFLVVADLAVLGIWATRPEPIYGELLGLQGTLDEPPVRRLLAWARWENGPRTPSGFFSLFDAGELIFAGVLILALVLLTIAPLAARRSEGMLSRRLRSPFRVAQFFGVRYRVRTALAAIALLGVYFGWEIQGWRTWLLRSQHLGRATAAGALENRSRTLMQSKREQLAKLTDADPAQFSELSAPDLGFYRSKAAQVAERRANMDRLNREIRHLSAIVAAYVEQRSKYEKAAANSSVHVEPDPPVANPEPELLDMMGSRQQARALAACDELARIYPDLVQAHSTAAWLRATSSDPSVRDGKLAVASAKRACELTGWRDFGELSVLAAACAEARDFAEAVKWQKKAAELNKNPRNEWLCRARLSFYQNGVPYHEGMPGRIQRLQTWP